jgi:hypothetical protein
MNFCVPSPALVIPVVSLFVSLSGTAIGRLPRREPT